MHVALSIVLVIIRLLLASIFIVQQRLPRSTLFPYTTLFRSISAAYHGYQDRYRAIPGDDPNASRWALGLAGDGIGRAHVSTQVTPLTRTPAPAAGTAESCLFWSDLRLAGFVSGNGTQQPFNA